MLQLQNTLSPVRMQIRLDITSPERRIQKVKHLREVTREEGLTCVLLFTLHEAAAGWNLLPLCARSER